MTIGPCTVGGARQDQVCQCMCMHEQGLYYPDLVCREDPSWLNLRHVFLARYELGFSHKGIALDLIRTDRTMIQSPKRTIQSYQIEKLGSSQAEEWVVPVPVPCSTLSRPPAQPKRGKIIQLCFYPFGL